MGTLALPSVLQPPIIKRGERAFENVDHRSIDPRILNSSRFKGKVITIVCLVYCNVDYLLGIGHDCQIRVVRDDDDLPTFLRFFKNVTRIS